MWDLGYAASGLNDLNAFFGKTKSTRKFYLTEADLEKLDEPLGPRKRILRTISDSKKAEKATTESSTVCS
jgi:hypothetical protein